MKVRYTGIWQGALLLLGAALLPSAEATPDAVSGANRYSVTTTLEQLGYPDGLKFTDGSLPHEQTLKFPLPLDMRAGSATLQLTYRGAPALSANASLSISVNGQQRGAVTLTADDSLRFWSIPIDAADMAAGQLSITLHSSIPVAYDHCVNNQPESGELFISPATALVAHYDVEPGSIRDRWLTLPQQVTISLPQGALDEVTLRAALAWALLLERNHHRVRMTRLPEMGEIVVAPTEEIAGLLRKKGNEPLWSSPESNIGVLSIDQKGVMALTPPYADANRFARQWRELVKDLHIDHEPAQRTPQAIEELPVEGFGVSTAPAQLARRVEWQGTITPWNLPPGTRPRSAELVWELPKTDIGALMRLYVYLNGRLVEARLLDNEGGPFHLSLPISDKRSDSTYQLRMVIRSGKGSDCTRPEAMLPIRLTSQSRIVVERDESEPQGFASLPTALGNGFELFVAEDYLERAERYLPSIARMLAGVAVDPESIKLKMFKRGALIQPHGHFVVVSDATPQQIEAALRFDEGSIDIVDHKDTVLYNNEQLRKMTVAQMVTLLERRGLWLHPGADPSLPRFNTSRLGNDDLALYAPDHLVLSVDTRQGDLARIVYEETPRWYVKLHDQRLIWLAIAWLLLTAGIAYLYYKSKQHRET